MEATRLEEGQQAAALDLEDPQLEEKLVNELKAQGIFDQFRKDCLSDVDTKPAYQNLRTRVDKSVSTLLNRTTWRPTLNKNQLRNQLRKHIQEQGVEAGVDRIVDQIVNPKMNANFMPEVENIIYKYFGTTKAEAEGMLNGNMEDEESESQDRLLSNGDSNHPNSPPKPEVSPLTPGESPEVNRGAISPLTPSNTPPPRDSDLPGVGSGATPPPPPPGDESESKDRDGGSQEPEPMEVETGESEEKRPESAYTPPPRVQQSFTPPPREPPLPQMPGMPQSPASPPPPPLPLEPEDSGGEASMSSISDTDLGDISPINSHIKESHETLINKTPEPTLQESPLVENIAAQENIEDSAPPTGSEISDTELKNDSPPETGQASATESQSETQEDEDLQQLEKMRAELMAQLSEDFKVSPEESESENEDGQLLDEIKESEDVEDVQPQQPDEQVFETEVRTTQSVSSSAHSSPNNQLQKLRNLPLPSTDVEESDLPPLPSDKTSSVSPSPPPQRPFSPFGGEDDDEDEDYADPASPPSPPSAFSRRMSQLSVSSQPPETCRPGSNFGSGSSSPDGGAGFGSAGGGSSTFSAQISNSSGQASTSQTAETTSKQTEGTNVRLHMISRVVTPINKSGRPQSSERKEKRSEKIKQENKAKIEKYEQKIKSKEKIKSDKFSDLDIFSMTKKPVVPFKLHNRQPKKGSQNSSPSTPVSSKGKEKEPDFSKKLSESLRNLNKQEDFKSKDIKVEDVKSKVKDNQEFKKPAKIDERRRSSSSSKSSSSSRDERKDSKEGRDKSKERRDSSSKSDKKDKSSINKDQTRPKDQSKERDRKDKERRNSVDKEKIIQEKKSEKKLSNCESISSKSSKYEIEREKEAAEVKRKLQEVREKKEKEAKEKDRLEKEKKRIRDKEKKELERKQKEKEEKRKERERQDKLEKERKEKEKKVEETKNSLKEKICSLGVENIQKILMETLAEKKGTKFTETEEMEMMMKMNEVIEKKNKSPSKEKSMSPKKSRKMRRDSSSSSSSSSSDSSDDELEVIKTSPASSPSKEAASPRRTSLRSKANASSTQDASESLEKSVLSISSIQSVPPEDDNSVSPSKITECFKEPTVSSPTDEEIIMAVIEEEEKNAVAEEALEKDEPAAEIKDEPNSAETEEKPTKKANSSIKETRMKKADTLSSKRVSLRKKPGPESLVNSSVPVEDSKTHEPSNLSETSKSLNDNVSSKNSTTPTTAKRSSLRNKNKPDNLSHSLLLSEEPTNLNPPVNSLISTEESPPNPPIVTIETRFPRRSKGITGSVIESADSNVTENTKVESATKEPKIIQSKRNSISSKEAECTEAHRSPRRTKGITGSVIGSADSNITEDTTVESAIKDLKSIQSKRIPSPSQVAECTEAFRSPRRRKGIIRSSTDNIDTNVSINLQEESSKEEPEVRSVIKDKELIRNPSKSPPKKVRFEDTVAEEEFMKPNDDASTLDMDAEFSYFKQQDIEFMISVKEKYSKLLEEEDKISVSSITSSELESSISPSKTLIIDGGDNPEETAKLLSKFGGNPRVFTPPPSWLEPYLFCAKLRVDQVEMPSNSEIEAHLRKRNKRLKRGGGYDIVVEWVPNTPPPPKKSRLESQLGFDADSSFGLTVLHSGGKRNRRANTKYSEDYTSESEQLDDKIIADSQSHDHETSREDSGFEDSCCLSGPSLTDRSHEGPGKQTPVRTTRKGKKSSFSEELPESSEKCSSHGQSKAPPEDSSPPKKRRSKDRIAEYLRSAGVERTNMGEIILNKNPQQNNEIVTNTVLSEAEVAEDISPSKLTSVEILDAEISAADEELNSVIKSLKIKRRRVSSGESSKFHGWAVAPPLPQTGFSLLKEMCPDPEISLDPAGALFGLSDIDLLLSPGPEDDLILDVVMSPPVLNDVRKAGKMALGEKKNQLVENCASEHIEAKALMNRGAVGGSSSSFDSLKENVPEASQSQGKGEGEIRSRNSSTRSSGLRSKPVP